MKRKRDAVAVGRTPFKPRPTEQYLRMLGDRVRDARACHGMTRNILARDSGVSERYLARLESGQGNFSIVLLRKVARAIDVPLSDLVNEGPEPPVEYLLLMEKLGRLSPSDLNAAASLLSRHFGDGASRRRRIALIGVRGVGKTTLGHMLAEHLKVPFVELTREIETEAGTSVSEIFELWGQAAYRRYERRALDRVVRTMASCVIATGGGIVSQPSTFTRLLDCCYTVWLQATPEEMMRRMARQGDYRVRGGMDERGAMADLRRILAQRRSLYGRADATLDTTGKSIEQALEKLLALTRGAQARTAAVSWPPRAREAGRAQR